MAPAEIIKHLNLSPHPEGGHYRETYRGEAFVRLDNGNTRNAGTAIYYFLQAGDKSHFHKVGSDELWFFHQGETVEIYILAEDGMQVRYLSNNLDAGHEPQLCIAANTWFAAKLQNNFGYALVSCTVSPGFEFNDFVIGDKATLKKSFPSQVAIIDDMAY